MERCVVWWIKRDARLADNEALQSAIATGLPVVPLFIFEPSIISSPEYSSMHAHAQSGAIGRLREGLEMLGAGCLTSYGECEEVFAELMQHVNIVHVFSTEETGPEITFARDRRMGSWFNAHAIPWMQAGQGGTVRGCPDRERQEKIRQAHYAAIPLPSPRQLPPLPQALALISHRPIPTYDQLGFSRSRHLLQRTGEPDVAAVLTGFLGGRGAGYRYKISSPSTAFETGSRLSAHLAWGTVSSRSVFHRIRQAELDSLPGSSRAKDLKAFRARLHWRDHFMQRLESAPWMEFRPLNVLFADLPYRDDPDEYLQAWLSGRTGFPMVDACMRCLSLTGFLNFRMRAMVTSFATHALRLDWRLVNAPLAALMYDYEPGIHISQVQMQAGVTGINTLRVYSPAKQLAEQDPTLSFVRKWIPELADVSTEDVLLAGNNQIPGYIAPLLNFADETRLMKDALYSRKKSPENEPLAAEVLAKYGSRLRRRAWTSKRLA